MLFLYTKDKDKKLTNSQSTGMKRYNYFNSSSNLESKVDFDAIASVAHVPHCPQVGHWHFDSREHLSGEDVVFPELSGGPDSDPAIMDLLLLTQANHTIYDYGSFGFWGAVLAGGTTMLADGYRSAH